MRLNAFVVICGVCSGSLASTITEKDPACVGVPLIIPEDEFKFNPGGRDPPEIAQLYGVIPPTAARAVVYGALAFPFGMDCVVMCSFVDFPCEELFPAMEAHPVNPRTTKTRSVNSHVAANGRLLK